MDQVVTFLNAVKTHRFWILCGGVFLASVAFGYLVWSSQSQQIAANVKEIEKANSQAKRVMQVSADLTKEGEEAADDVRPIHPNSKTSEGLRGNIEVGKKQVVEIWRKEEQKQQPLFKWPNEIFDYATADGLKAAGGNSNDKMGDRLRVFVERLGNNRPGTEYFAVNSTGNYTEDSTDTTKLSAEELAKHNSVTVVAADRKLIKNYIARWLPLIAARGEAKWELPIEGVEITEKKEAAEMFSGTKKLVWKKANQTFWLNRCTQFKGKNGNQSETPHTSQLVYLQEDLSVLSDVFEVIKKTNQKHPGAIRVVREVLVGNEAVKAKAMKFDGSGGSVFGSSEGEGMGALMSSPLGGGKGSDDGLGEGSASSASLADPCNDRYVDFDFDKIGADELRQGIRGEGEASISEGKISNEAWRIVYRRLPVRVRVLIDERFIDEFLTQCANADLPIEVRSFALMPGNAELKVVKKKSGGMGDEGGASSSRGGSKGGDLGGGGLLSGGTSGSADSKSAIEVKAINASLQQHPEFNTHFYVPFEVYGVIKLYNKVNPGAFLPNGGEGEGDGAAE